MSVEESLWGMNGARPERGESRKHPEDLIRFRYFVEEKSNRYWQRTDAVGNQPDHLFPIVSLVDITDD